MRIIVGIILLLNAIHVHAQSFNCGDTIIDIRDGKTYATVLIGSQCWMKENLNFGLQINDTINQSNNAVFEKYCYNNDSVNCDLYGGLYQRSESMNHLTAEKVQGICPENWHLPSDDEWKQMEMYLGMDSISADSIYGIRGTDQGAQLIWGGSSGFDALYGGVYHGVNKVFSGMNNYTLFWTSTITSTSNSVRRGLYDYDTGVFSGVSNVNEGPLYGYCVRCISDNKSLDIKNVVKNENLIIYPVPAKEKIFIKWIEDSEGILIQIYDTYGRVVKFLKSNHSNTSVNVADLKPGMYIVKLTSKHYNTSAVRKIQIAD